MGIDGEIEVVGDPALTAGDCRIEWSTGGARRDMRELLAEVDGIIDRHYGHAECRGPGDRRRPKSRPAADSEEIAARPDAEEQEIEMESHGEQTADVVDGPEGTSDGGETPPAGDDDGSSRPE